MWRRKVDPVLLARLAEHRSLGSAPRAELEWLVAHGQLRTLGPGQVLSPKGQPVKQVYIFLSGYMAIHIDRGAGSHRIFSWRGGDVGGLLPYSRGAVPPNDMVAEEPTELLVLPNTCLAELPRRCPTVTATMVHAMLDRARQFNAADLRDEKLVALGRLAAGLSHELNNPASAAARSARRLREHLDAAEASATVVGSARLSDAQLAAVETVRTLCAEAAEPGELSALARADREDAIGAWLAAHGADESSAEALAETALTLEALEQLSTVVRGEAFDAVLRWLAASCQVRALAAEIQLATARIYELVDSVKGFTFMDRAPTPGPVDVRKGITDTLTMLRSKMRSREAEVVTEFADGIPPAHAVGAELNQVWMNLIDNALDAVPRGGRVVIKVEPVLDRVVVRIVDNGAGIPAEILGRIFDPFFTTKGVGQGTGLGLDIVRRILRRHDGEVEVHSEPGRTEFQVTLLAVPQAFAVPLEPGAATA